MTDILFKKIALAEKENISATKKNLMLALNFLCDSENVPRIKNADFEESLKDSYTEVSVRKFLGITVGHHFKIRLKKNSRWPVVLIHEFTHYVRYLDSRDLEHSYKFRKLNDFYLRHYFNELFVRQGISVKI